MARIPATVRVYWGTILTCTNVNYKYKSAITAKMHRVRFLRIRRGEINGQKFIKM